MDARHWIFVLALLMSFPGTANAQRPAQARSRNFVVVAATPALAEEFAQAAEQLRQDLSMLWLGTSLPDWPAPCPILTKCGPQLLAGGKTTFTFTQGTVLGWEMEVYGTRERILDSVLPHEITHTILATHFAPLGKPVPRWADEGACTTVEHTSERVKHDRNLIDFIYGGTALPFAVMFTLRDYPRDMMPLYAQGYSVTSFLIAQVGHQNFVKFLEEGMQTEDWVMATDKYFGYPTIGKLQTSWNAWVEGGGGQVANFVADARGFRGTPYLLASARQSQSNTIEANTIDDGAVRLASNQQPSFGNQSDFNSQASFAGQPSMGTQPSFGNQSAMGRQPTVAIQPENMSQPGRFEGSTFSSPNDMAQNTNLNRQPPSRSLARSSQLSVPPTTTGAGNANEPSHYQRLLRENAQSANQSANAASASNPFPAPPANPPSLVAPNLGSPAANSASLTPPPSYSLSDSQSAQKPFQNKNWNGSGRSVINR